MGVAAIRTHCAELKKRKERRKKRKGISVHLTMHLAGTLPLSLSLSLSCDECHYALTASEFSGIIKINSASSLFESRRFRPRESESRSLTNIDSRSKLYRETSVRADR